MKYTAEQLQHFTQIIRTLPEERRQEARELVKSIDDFPRADDALADFVLSVNTDGATESKRKATKRTRKAPASGQAVKSTNKTISSPNEDVSKPQTANINRLERVDGETIEDNNILDTDALYHNIESVLMAYCDKMEIDGKEGLRKAPQRVWTASCQHVGKSVFKPNNILKDRTLTNNGSATLTTSNRYSIPKLVQALGLYETFCNEYNKAMFIDAAAHFCGVTDQTLYNLGGELTSLGFDFDQKRELSLASGIADGKQSPVGLLAILNHNYGWNTATTQRVERTETTVIYPVLVDINKNDVKQVDGANVPKLEESQ